MAGIRISCTTYDDATDAIVAAGRAAARMTVAATSMHGLTLGAMDPGGFGAQLNTFDILTPDGQPVRWALNLLHGAQLSDRVYGPTLMLQVCRAAAQESLGVYLYGSREPVLEALVQNLQAKVTGLQVVGHRSPPFRALSRQEDEADVRAIRDSGASILFVGLGCPQQEQWAHAHRERLSMPVVCVGAAFDFHAGTLPQAPAWMQAHGLEWLFRLLKEPRRLWRRYVTYIPIFVFLVTRQYISINFRRIRSISLSAPH